MQSITLVDIQAKEDEIAAWELRLADAVERMNSATWNYRLATITWDNVKDVLGHLRRQLRAMQRAYACQDIAI